MGVACSRSPLLTGRIWPGPIPKLLRTVPDSLKVSQTACQSLFLPSSTSSLLGFAKMNPITWLWGKIKAHEKVHVAWCVTGIVGCLMLYGVLQVSAQTMLMTWSTGQVWMLRRQTARCTLCRSAL